MKLADIITQAQMISGLGEFGGNAIEQNLMATSIALFHQTLNSINNDPKIVLRQKSWDYQETALAFPLPSDCRRAIKVISGTVELRKTDYSEIVRSRNVPSFMNMFAVNDRKIELILPGRVTLVYAQEFREYMPQDEVDLPLESIDYVINLLAYNIALAFSLNSAQRCQLLSEKSYNALLGNLRVNEGEKYQNPYSAYNRFSGRSGVWL